ncbi:UNKNOWN [Stylonychia lemnae]|uniref:Uncharacterized protein n=1 Tax=Stylonychia lemnae TaxID=5949 RepID=A0A078AVG2_STYLE|nr:UNKNOWN [Stylonychia lemnae]|eukprot:CDW84818.1 UNKNOWN [Stylonychia lemnae]
MYSYRFSQEGYDLWFFEAFPQINIQDAFESKLLNQDQFVLNQVMTLVLSIKYIHSINLELADKTAYFQLDNVSFCPSQNIFKINTPLVLKSLKLKVIEESNSDSEEKEESELVNTEVDVSWVILKSKEIIQNFITARDDYVQKLIQAEVNDMDELLQHIQRLSQKLFKSYSNEREEQENQDSIESSSVTQMFGAIDFNGFDGKLILTHQDNMIEQLQIHKYQLSKLDIKSDDFEDLKTEKLILIGKIVRITILRCSLDLSDNLFRSREKLLLENDYEKYIEQVKQYLETQKWIVQELQQKAIDMLDLNKYFNSNEYDSILSIKCLEQATNFLTLNDSQLLEVFKSDSENLMQNTTLPKNLNKSVLLQIAKYFKLSVIKILDQASRLDKNIEDNMFEEAIKIEDELLYIFKIQRRELIKAIIDFHVEEEFQM